MRAIIQRVNKAQVFVRDSLVSQIQKGLLVFVGFKKGESQDSLLKASSKIVNLRIFEDVQGKFNLSLRDVEGEVLCVSQFTLYADIRKGRRPSFEEAETPLKAHELYDTFCKLLENQGVRVERGIFGERMNVVLENWGPVTIILDTDYL